MTLEVVEVEVTEVDNGHAQGGRQPREVRQTDIDKEFVKGHICNMKSRQGKCCKGQPSQVNSTQILLLEVSIYRVLVFIDFHCPRDKRKSMKTKTQWIETS